MIASNSQVRPPSPPEERAVSQDLSRQADQFIAEWRQAQVQETPHIALSSASARVGESVEVSGTNFYQNETVDIHLHASLVKQVQADSQGGFDTSIEVPTNSPPPGFRTTISATVKHPPSRLKVRSK